MFIGSDHYIGFCGSMRLMHLRSCDVRKAHRNIDYLLDFSATNAKINIVLNK